MKQDYIPLEKRSKRAIKDYHKMQRKDWGNVNPITKRTENKKAYNRKKSNQRWQEHGPMVGFFYG